MYIEFDDTPGVVYEARYTKARVNNLRSTTERFYTLEGSTVVKCKELKLKSVVVNYPSKPVHLSGTLKESDYEGLIYEYDPKHKSAGELEYKSIKDIKD